MSEAIGIVERLNDLRLAAFRAGGFDTPAAKAYYCALSTAFQRDELVDAAEISRLTARIAELEKALKPVRDLPVECVDALHPAYQRQIDMDGVEVGVSRQAVDDIHAALIKARTTLEASERGGGE